jgi:hemerythrin-like domain-containing protein
MYSTIDILSAEHVALSTLLRAAMSIVVDSRERRQPPDFDILRAMLFYVAEFPERHHHRKESMLLFPRLRARTLLARSLLDRLDEDHLRGEARIRELEHALTAFQVLGESRREAFESALRQYVEFHQIHMGLEEKNVFPLARQVLQERDWEELDAEFEADRDPLTGAQPQDEYAALFVRLRQHLSATWAAESGRT